MENLRRLEKQRRKWAARAERAVRDMWVAHIQKRRYEKAISEIVKKKNPQGVEKVMADIRAMITELKRPYPKKRRRCEWSDVAGVEPEMLFVDELAGS